MAGGGDGGREQTLNANFEAYHENFELTYKLSQSYLPLHSKI